MFGEHSSEQHFFRVKNTRGSILNVDSTDFRVKRVFFRGNVGFLAGYDYLSFEST